MTAREIITALRDLAKEEKKDFFPRFFKTGKGEYAEGDKFLGVTVPDQKTLVKKYGRSFSLEELEKLIKSPYHEARHTAALMLVMQYEKASPQKREDIVGFYLRNKAYFNNWDLVDSSCYKILGRHAYETRNPDLLLILADEESLWAKRIAVVGSLYHIRNYSFKLPETLILKNLNHPHDLMHKANGWMLREMGKRDLTRLLAFLDRHCLSMPRTTLRYAIEKLEPGKRKFYLEKGKVLR